MYSPNDPERQKLLSQIKEWNTNRLDLFEISEPDEYLEYYGVMRFFYQGDDMKYQTKCLRVSSTATTRDLIEALMLKFHPDTSMPSNDRFTLYECHNLQERRMKDSEHPLVVQLHWANDDRDGKFILKNESRRRRSVDMTTHNLLNNYRMSKSTTTLTNGFDNPNGRSHSTSVYTKDDQTNNPPNSANNNSSSNFFARHFSTSKKAKRKSSSGHFSSQSKKDNHRNESPDNPSSNQIHSRNSHNEQPPESSFTRTISNPDEVMKRRRQKKLESRLEQFSGLKGSHETGGTLKIYGDSINQDIPYKTLLLSVNDTADKVLAETLEKYGLGHEDQRCYILVQQNIAPREGSRRNELPDEIILHDQDCPLGILVNCPPKRGYATFAIRRRTPNDQQPMKPRAPPIIMSNGTIPREIIQSPAESKRRGDKKHRNKRPNQLVNERNSVVSSDVMHGFLDFPRLIKLSEDQYGNMCEDETQIFSLSPLLKNSDSPTEGIKFIKIGSQESSVGPPPNILLPLDFYPDIRPNHCHISAKFMNIATAKSNGSNASAVRLQLTPSLDTQASIPKHCLVYVNEELLEKPVKLNHEDYIQLGEMLMFKFEEYENEDNIIGSTSSNVLLDHMRQEGSLSSIQMDYLTADLPISVQYEYESSEKIISKLIGYSRKYANQGCYDLFRDVNTQTSNDEVNLSSSFRLVPAYSFYLILRASLSIDNKAGHVLELITKALDQVIQEDQYNVEKEIFWLSNTSELLHLIQCDNELRGFSGRSQDVLAAAIEHAFSNIQNELSQDIMTLLPFFLQEDDSDMSDDVQEDQYPCMQRAVHLIQSHPVIESPIKHLLQTLSFAHELFTNCQLNVALTIQMFSQLFHLINCWLTNYVLGDPTLVEDVGNREGLNGLVDDGVDGVPVTQEWGYRLMRRLNRIKEWGEINGLEMATNCHMQKMYQIAELMRSDKTDLKPFGEKCMEFVNINNNQLNHLLFNCKDFALSEGWIDVITKSAMEFHKTMNSNNDSSANKHGGEHSLPLYEDMDLRLPLLLPADGYCCDRGIVSAPRDLRKILMSLQRSGLDFKLNPPTTDDVDTRWKSYLGNYEHTPSVSRSNTLAPDQSSSNPASPSYQKPHLPRQPISGYEVVTPVTNNPQHRKPENLDSIASEESDVFKASVMNRYTLKLKKINNSLGLSIISARKTPRDTFRIYVKDVVPNGAADNFGKIERGDQLVSVDGKLLDGLGQEDAVELMKKTKSSVKLVMERGAAQRHGVTEYISDKQQKSRVESYSKPPMIKAALPIKHKSDGKSQKNSRSEYTLPPLPPHIPKKQTQEKAPARPPKTSTSSDNKNPHNSIRAQRPPIKAQLSKTSNQNPTDYNSLPIRNKRDQLKQKQPIQGYATVRNKSNKELNETPRPRTQSNSQPDLYMASKPTYVEKRAAISENESSSSEDESTSSYQSSTEEEVPTSTPTKPSLQPKQSTQLQLSKFSPANKTRNKPTNQNHAIKMMPRPLVPGYNRNEKEKLSSESSSGSDETDTEVSTEDDSYNMDVTQSPIPVVQKPYKQPEMSPSPQIQKPPPIRQEPQGQISDSSSYTESTSSSYESQKREEESTQMTLVNKQNNMPNNVVDSSSPKPVHYTKRNESSVDMRPQSSINILPETQLDSPRQDVPKIKVDRPQSELIQPSNHNAGLPQPSSYPKYPLFTPPPKPTASHPQYHPPSQLEENPVYSQNSTNDIPSISKDEDDDVKVRRKTTYDKITKEIAENKQENNPRQRLSDSDIKVPNSIRDSSLRYGRPQFNTNSRPVSLYKPTTIASHDLSHSNSSMISPNGEVSGIVVAAPQPIPSNYNIIGTHEVYNESSINKNRPPVAKISDEPVESLSFREKMKLFAQKNGDEDVKQRTKFSTKQRRIESGIYD